MRLSDCHNFHDFRKLAERRLPGPIFNYIDGAADDEATLRQNTASFERCDLVPNVLRGVGNIDMSGDHHGPETGDAGLLLADRAATAVPP
jgi:L-lactate dehydrogenase (cytochrome)